MNNMKIIGVQNNAYKLFESFLTDRRYITVFNRHKTSNKIVPRGSVFGPLLFLIHINEISCFNIVIGISICRYVEVSISVSKNIDI